MKSTTSDETRRSTTERVREKVGDATESVQETVSHIAGEARDKGEQLIDEGREKAYELRNKAGEVARLRADQEKERLTNGFRTFADVLRRGSDDLTADRNQYRPILNSAADRVEGISNYLEQHDVDALTNDVRRFAREHTPLFVGGAFALGFAGARFLKSSGERARAAAHASYGREERFDRMLPEPDRVETRTESSTFQDRGGVRGGTYE